MAKPPLTPTPEQLRAVFQNSVQYEIVYTFGVPSHHPADYAQWEFINYSRAAHARLLYGFLSTSSADRYQDDVVAEDYGFAPRPGLLSPEDRERLNKDLLHLSFGRLRHTPETKKWPDHILGNLLAPTLDFMRFIRDERTDVFGSKGEAFGWNQIIAILESGRALEVYAFTMEESLAYIFGVGEHLPDGKPRFTRHIGLIGKYLDSWDG